jgi:hypothetical protein
MHGNNGIIFHAVKKLIVANTTNNIPNVEVSKGSYGNDDINNHREI